MSRRRMHRTEADKMARAQRSFTLATVRPFRTPVIKRSKYGFDSPTGNARSTPPSGPGNRKVTITLPKLNLPPLTEED